jgi:putative PEP-CTERM system TPR-repeat lipoprotein
LSAAALVLGLAAAAVPTAPLAAAEPTYLDALAAGRQAMQKGDLRLAEIEMRNAAKTFPNNPDIHLLLAQILLKLGNSPDAEAEARLARWHHGEDDDVTPVLAQAMLQQNELGQLVQQVAPGARAPKAEASVRLSLAMAHLGLGETAAGEELLRDAQRLDPASDQTQLGLARLDLVKGDYAGAERALAAARAAAPDSIDVLRLAADLARAKGDTDGALAAYGKALTLHPDDLGLLTGHAMLLISVNRLDDAQKDVDAALNIAPFSLTPNFLAGLLLARRGDLHGADDALMGVSGAFDALPNGFYLLGAIKYELHQYDTAIYYLQRFIARRPDHVGARQILADSAMHMGDPARAIEVLRPVADENPTDRKTTTLLAQAYLASGRKDAVIALYQAAAQDKSGDVRRRTEAAVMKIGLGDPTTGTAELEKIAAGGEGLDVAGPVFVLNEINNGQLGKAASTAELMVARDAKDVMAENLLGTVRLAQLDYAAAETLFRDAVARDPKFLTARRNLAQTYLATNQPDRARETDLALLEVQPDDAATMVALAELTFRAGNESEAAEWLAKAQAAAPNEQSIAVRIAHFYAGQKKWDKAIAAANALLAKNPDDPNAVELLAWARAGSGDASGAAAAYLALMQRVPASTALDRRRAVYQHLAGDTDGARTSLQRALGLSPNDAAVITDLVNLAFDTGGADEAVATARAYEQRVPELSDLLAANALMRENRRAEAIAVLRDGERWHPSVRTAGRLAELIYQAGQRDEGKAMLNALLEKHDELAPRLALGDIYMAEQQYDKAQACYERALALAPSEPIALNNLAWLYARAGDKRAREVAITAYRVAPNPVTADTLGWVLLGGGDRAIALPLLERAASDLPQDLEVQYHFAAALQASGSVDRARTLLEKIVGSKTPFTDREDAAHRLEDLSRG